MNADANPLVSEKELRRLQAALKASQIGIFEFEPQTNLAFWDDKVRELWGIPAGETITYETVLAQVHPDDHALHDKSTQEALDPHGTGQMDMEYRVIPRDGSPMRWIRATATATFQNDRPIRLLGTVQDVTERREYENRNELLLFELQHRVKNTLATILSIINMSKKGQNVVEEYSLSLQDRLISMAETHNVISKSDWKKVDIRSLLVKEFQAFFGDRPNAYTISGVDLLIPAPNVQIMSMAIHELLTNAIKHGALLHPNGTIDVTITKEDKIYSFNWVEKRGVPLASIDNPSGGFGSFLLTEILKAEFRGDVNYKILPEGLVFKLQFHEEVISDDESNNIAP
jgi:PAS domain S-box-containing protein